MNSAAAPVVFGASHRRTLDPTLPDPYIRPRDLETHVRTATSFGWTFAITSSAWFAFALDRLVVTTALPVIRTDLGAGLAGAEWTVNAYTLSFAVLLLAGAALGDRFGRRRMFALGTALFTTGSAAAALAPSIGVLVAARVAQGAGGAIFVPLALTLLSAATPPERRGAALGAWGGIGGLGACVGPLVGGGLTGWVGWQWIFWLNVPLGLALVPLARLRLPESHASRSAARACSAWSGP
jgi:MFS family permease